VSHSHQSSTPSPQGVPVAYPRSFRRISPTTMIQIDAIRHAVYAAPTAKWSAQLTITWVNGDESIIEGREASEAWKSLKARCYARAHCRPEIEVLHDEEDL
jgi:hypothetical protein